MRGCLQMNNRVSSNILPNLLRAAAQGAADLQASDLVALEVGDVMGITDWFLIASSSNVRQVRRVAEEIESAVKKSGGEGPIRIEGLEEAKWILMDFGIFVVHVFHKETRDFTTLNDSGQMYPGSDSTLMASQRIDREAQ